MENRGRENFWSHPPDLNRRPTDYETRPGLDEEKPKEKKKE